MEKYRIVPDAMQLQELMRHRLGEGFLMVRSVPDEGWCRQVQNLWLYLKDEKFMVKRTCLADKGGYTGCAGNCRYGAVSGACYAKGI